MKIEKVNENQIRCTLTREDLATRQLKISELAYGTEKAKSLFRDMMVQANHEFGFEAEDIPLMIEAIPLNSECIVLVITKVEDPEELDTRFARFSPSIAEELEELADRDEPDAEVLDLFRHLETVGKGEPLHSEEPKAEPVANRSRIFGFSSLSHVMEAASIIVRGYEGDSTLYKNHAGQYLLLLCQSNCSNESFDRACNIASEYGAIRRNHPGSSAFIAEHCEVLIPVNAIKALGQV